MLNEMKFFFEKLLECNWKCRFCLRSSSLRRICVDQCTVCYGISEVWIKQLAAEGAKWKRPYWLTHRLVLTDVLHESLNFWILVNVKKLFSSKSFFLCRKEIFYFRFIIENSISLTKLWIYEYTYLTYLIHSHSPS